MHAFHNFKIILCIEKFGTFRKNARARGKGDHCEMMSRGHGLAVPHTNSQPWPPAQGLCKINPIKMSPELWRDS